MASFPADAGLKEELLDKAEWAMNVAKRQGRDRVVTFASGQSDDAAAELGPQNWRGAAKIPPDPHRASRLDS